ncbi:MAG TPA: DAK2 domain-containing protein [Pseudonocardia sp.]
MQVLDAVAVRRWADACVEVLAAHRAELDRTNVFPIADGDTGTNLSLTLRAAAESLHRLPPAAEPTVADAAAALAQGALRGARGNSGVIVSQLLRGLAEALADCPPDGRAIQAGLRRADDLARASVGRPVEGTLLTVLRAAAAAGTAGTAPGQLGAVLDAAVAAAAAALAETPRQLPVLARAGVVDAGGLGAVLLLGALASVVHGRPAADAVAGLGGEAAAAEVPPPHRARDRDALVGPREAGSAEFDYEVMYLLADSTEARVDGLRDRLADLGDSVAVVGDGRPDGLWHVHVHCTDVGAAIEAGIAAGRPNRVTVVRFADQAAEQARLAAEGRFRTARAVVTVVSGEPVAELVRSDAVVAVVAVDGPPGVGRIGAAVAGTRARHVVVLPNDVGLTEVAEEAAEAARAAGAEVVVVPTSSVLQGLAALAVHDAGRRAGDDVVAMAEAAAATRTGVIQIAEGEALTWVGRCQAGDVLGLVDGEVVLIEQDLGAAACQLADRMLTTGGELVTVLLGADAADDLGAELAGHLRGTHPEVEVVRYRGGPAGRPVQLGVE